MQSILELLALPPVPGESPAVCTRAEQVALAIVEACGFPHAGIVQGYTQLSPERAQAWEHCLTHVARPITECVLGRKAWTPVHDQLWEYIAALVTDGAAYSEAHPDETAIGQIAFYVAERRYEYLLSLREHLVLFCGAPSPDEKGSPFA